MLSQVQKETGAPAAPGLILVTDDDRNVRASVAMGLRRMGFETLEAAGGNEALETLREARPFLVLADLAMPGTGGIELVEAVKERHPEVDVVLMGGHVDSRSALEAIRAGAFDLLRKPFLMEELRVAVERVRERQDLKHKATELELLRERERLSRAHLLQVLTGMANVIDAKSQYTREHSDRVAHSCGTLARFLELPEEQVEDITFGGKLHDIGKVGTPDRILNSSGALAREDREIIMAHPVDGARILEPMELLRDIAPMVRLHHESWDGTGYPDGRKGDETPVGARIVKLADYFDAITSRRPYRSPMAPEQACEVMAGEAGRQLDPELTSAFLELVRAGAFPAHAP